MDAVTYPDERVVAFMNEHVVPVKVHISREPLPEQYNVQWTPTLVLADAEGKEHHRTVGGLSPEDLNASLLLGIGQTHIDRGECSSARTALQRVMSDYLDSDAAPEALYLSGVVRYKQSDDIHEMNETLTQHREKHPTREWMNRASVHERTEQGQRLPSTFALMPEAHPLVRNQVNFVGVFAPSASKWSLAMGVASSARTLAYGRERWLVDLLTRKVSVHSLIATLEPGDAEALRRVLSLR